MSCTGKGRPTSRPLLRWREPTQLGYASAEDCRQSPSPKRLQSGFPSMLGSGSTQAHPSSDL
eukprot:361273-Chlamydomonas_euryale.AAC.2